MKLLYQTPGWFRHLYPGMIWRMPVADKRIFLTFDDGPVPEVTPWVVEQLARYHAKATFFCVGENVLKHPGELQQVVAAGHALGNHTHNHLKGWSVSDQRYVNNVSLCDQALLPHQQDLRFFRPPYGRIRRSQIRLLHPQKSLVMWSHLSWDFDEKLSIAKSLKYLKQASPGSILVFHDSPKTFQNLQLLLPEVLAHFHAQGFTFHTLYDTTD